MAPDATGDGPEDELLAKVLSMYTEECARQQLISETQAADAVKSAGEESEENADDKAKVEDNVPKPTTRALAAICQVVFASNDFLYSP